MTVIRRNPLFEIYIENDHLVVNNTDFRRDNGIFEIDSITSVELIRNLSFINKIIETTFGLNVPAKSSELRINLENGFKDIVLTHCDLKKVELLIYKINQAIIKRENEKPSLSTK
ncbi:MULTISPECIES: hypothetical protein [Flavobacterium]|uniref:Uncharacterized protein n=1 Tax=Flavobacterium quisquiliarum TaxID=1834436 RepID=A0ABV8WDD5_9FLAO|nr:MULTISPECIES: hypothetical protein [Flavobacterium]MBW1657905.1 hypothetical protein [Flavobacterium quisquiliarum]NWL00963.1 hypothetical protein [Flavobacterium collinsii]